MLARRSDVNGRVACQKRADWSRPAIGTPSDAATQCDNRRHRSRARTVACYRLSLSRDSHPSSGLNPHLRCPSPPRTVPADRERARVKARPPQTGRRGRHTEVHRRYTGGTFALGPLEPSPRSRTAAGEGEVRSAARGPGPGWHGPAALALTWRCPTRCGPQDAGRRAPAGRVGQDARGHARPPRTAIAVHGAPGRRHVPGSRRAGNLQALNTLRKKHSNPRARVSAYLRLGVDVAAWPGRVGVPGRSVERSWQAWLCNRLPAFGLAFERRAGLPGPCRGVAQKRRERCQVLEVGVPAAVPPGTREEEAGHDSSDDRDRSAQGLAHGGGDQRRGRAAG
jgi:hypothetical protein